MNRILLLAVLIYALLLLGLATFSRGLMALAAPLIVYLAAAWLGAPREAQLRVSRKITPDRAPEDTPVTVHLGLVNEGEAIPQVLVEDLLPGPVRPISGHPSVLTALAAGQSLELEYEAQARRGRHGFRDVRIAAFDALGLYRKEAIAAAPADLSARPEARRLRRLAIRPLRTRGNSGLIPARLGGPGIDFYGVRGYQVGDPRRWINWRVSARHDEALFTNEFEVERTADVGLILDARLRNEIRLDGESAFEHAVHATAALADAFLLDGNRVGLLIYGQYMDWTLPGYGKVQRERILQALARAEPGESQVFENLDHLPTRLFPAQSQLVLVSVLSREDVPVLTRLRARGYQLLVVRPDAVEMEARSLPAEEPVRLAARILQAERRLVRRRLQQAGIQVVDWRVDRPFDEAIHTGLGRLPQWFRWAGADL